MDDRPGVEETRNQKQQALKVTLQTCAQLLDKHRDEVQDGEKRSFNSWGGKRTSELQADEKRAFNSWGGKRNGKEEENHNEKRAFNSWGGKRSQEDEKRAFNSWGGKRSQEDEKRAFNSWGGKRSEAEISSSTDGKRAFKSRDGNQEQKVLRQAKENHVEGEKRAFNSWGGKRSGLENENDNGLSELWGGETTGDKRVLDTLQRSTRAASPASGFWYSWGTSKKGHRSTPVRRKPVFNAWGGKRAASFGAWGGKRDVSSVSEEGEVPEAQYPWRKTVEGADPRLAQVLGKVERLFERAYSGKGINHEQINN